MDRVARRRRTKLQRKRWGVATSCWNPWKNSTFSTTAALRAVAALERGSDEDVDQIPRRQRGSGGRGTSAECRGAGRAQLFAARRLAAETSARGRRHRTDVRCSNIGGYAPEALGAALASAESTEAKVVINDALGATARRATSHRSRRPKRYCSGYEPDGR